MSRHVPTFFQQSGHTAKDGWGFDHSCLDCHSLPVPHVLSCLEMWNSTLDLWIQVGRSDDIIIV